MPSRKQHVEFDLILANKGVLLPNGEYGSVHSFMDQGVKSFGAEHREYDVYHREAGLRQWLNGKYNVIGQDGATDWLRAGLGHICLDETDSSLWRRYSWESVYDSAYSKMVQRGWTRARFVWR